jgi:N-acetyl-gamma-glutamyl-phosphate reductase
MINIGIIGATGYTGEELINILLGHPQARITYLAAKINKPTPIAEIFPKLKDRIDLICKPLDIDSAISKSDLLFLALPHTVSMNVAPKLLKANKKVIDLSADYRLRNLKIYEKFYKTKHNDVDNLKKAIYGLPEIYRAQIKKASFIANPGCYPTAAILGLAPLIACQAFGNPKTVIIDAKSGVTGAGRRAVMEYNFSEVNEDAYAYKVNIHQHMPEINQELSKLARRPIKITFVPHLISVDRGILETIYIEGNQKSFDKLRTLRRRILSGVEVPATSNQKLIELYKRFYKQEPFIRIKESGKNIRLKDVTNTNFCDIAIRSFPEQSLIIIITAIDNLGKGAAGQAVQNMNIMCGFTEQTALL